MERKCGRGFRGPAIVAVLVWVIVGAACATLEQVAALRRVAFELDRVSGGELAGVPIARLRSYQDLSAADVARIGVALARDELPLDFTLHVRAENPADNPVARLLEMEWSLWLDETETVAGELNRAYELTPGEAQDIPLDIRLDLLDFFDGRARDLVELALAVAGAEAEPTRISLRATPTIDTPLGPIRYPQPITIVSRTVGGE